MTNLQCSVDKCGNNKIGLCCRPNIDVRGTNAVTSSETSCHSYVPKTNSVTNSTQYNSPNQALVINCSARSCAYNTQSKCSADSIVVNYSASGTECSTFVDDLS